MNKPKKVFHNLFKNRDFVRFLNFHDLIANFGITLGFQVQRDSVEKLTSKSQLFILICQVMA